MSKRLAPGARRRARLTRQGQITVPKSIRDALGARPGDDIEFVVKGESMLIELRPRRSVLDFAGLAADAANRIPGTAEELDTLIDGGLATQAASRRRAPGART
ncbi:MAG: AbrB/MazE/SpoVT family DNA-binding domain-containing protein [Chloroflexota bacterium]